MHAKKFKKDASITNRLLAPLDWAGSAQVHGSLTACSFALWNPDKLLLCMRIVIPRAKVAFCFVDSCHILIFANFGTEPPSLGNS